MSNTIICACNFNHIIHPLQLPEKQDRNDVSLTDRVTGVALMILSIPLSLGIFAGLYLYWAHRKIKHIEAQNTAFSEKIYSSNPEKIYSSTLKQAVSDVQRGITPKTNKKADAVFETIIEYDRLEIIQTCIESLKEYLKESKVKDLLEKAKSVEMATQLLECIKDKFEGDEANNRYRLYWNIDNINVKQALLEMGMDPNQVKDYGGRSFLRECKNPKVAQLLIDHGADVNVTDSDGNTLLHTCYDLEMSRVLIEGGANVNAENNYDWTPLQTNSNPAIAQLLIDNGADVKVKDALGRTLLHNCEDPELAQIYIDAGADINAKDNKGKTALQQDFHSPSKNQKAVLKLLIEKEADIKVTDELGHTLLHSYFDIKLCTLLLDKYPEAVHVKSQFKQTPLAFCFSEDKARLLIERGADVNTRDKNDNTPLHRCSSKGMAKALIENGADLNAKNKDGKTPLECSTNEKVQEVIRKALEKQEVTV